MVHSLIRRFIRKLKFAPALASIFTGTLLAGVSSPDSERNSGFSPISNQMESSALELECQFFSASSEDENTLSYRRSLAFNENVAESASLFNSPSQSRVWSALNNPSVASDYSSFKSIFSEEAKSWDENDRKFFFSRLGSSLNRNYADTSSSISPEEVFEAYRSGRSVGKCGHIHSFLSDVAKSAGLDSGQLSLMSEHGGGHLIMWYRNPETKALNTVDYGAIASFNISDLSSVADTMSLFYAPFPLSFRYSSPSGEIVNQRTSICRVFDRLSDTVLQRNSSVNSLRVVADGPEEQHVSFSSRALNDSIPGAFTAGYYSIGNSNHLFEHRYAYTGYAFDFGKNKFLPTSAYIQLLNADFSRVFGLQDENYSPFVLLMNLKKSSEPSLEEGFNAGIDYDFSACDYLSSGEFRPDVFISPFISADFRTSSNQRWNVRGSSPVYLLSGGFDGNYDGYSPSILGYNQQDVKLSFLGSFEASMLFSRLAEDFFISGKLSKSATLMRGLDSKFELEKIIAFSSKSDYGAPLKISGHLSKFLCGTKAELFGGIHYQDRAIPFYIQQKNQEGITTGLSENNPGLSFSAGLRYSF